ncbi:MAG: SDR family oxidoreductase [Proteobacteria bacterium]|nr:SDR family oxidoreductase [Pseudomonadota bacterium]MBU4470774.1 SDR family oxidoreductase [Pseudomonadota bacterium]MCG2751498.1 SDR family oxidoreductase [Desulfobacteraceae bacterium]
MDLQLKGKRAIVTGGTRGIGRTIADTLANEGCHVAVCARNSDEISKTVEALKSKGVSAFGGVVDITDGRSLKDWIMKAGTELGGLDILVSNVGAMAMGADMASWEKNLRTDICGAVNAIETALPMLETSAKENGDAAIVAIGSAASVNATEPSSYGAIKGAIVHYIKGLAKQNAVKHIRANVVSPGMVYFKGGVWHRVEQGMPDFFKKSLAQNPMGRMASPQDIANAVVFLASPCSSFTSGINMIVDGAITDRVNY